MTTNCLITVEESLMNKIFDIYIDQLQVNFEPANVTVLSGILYNNIS